MSSPPARGVRRPWAELPEALLVALEEALGGRVVETETQHVGFSPAIAERVRTEHGRRAFVKACGPEPNPTSPGFYRREAAIAAALPEGVPVPRLLWTYDDGDWVALAFEDVEGRHPREPWEPRELRRVLEAHERLMELLTPSPIDAPPAEDAFRTGIRGFAELLEEPREGLDAWSARHLARLAELEAKAPEAVRGETLLHFDLRADNVLLTDDEVWFVDWPWAMRGAPWVDLVAFAPSVAMQGGPEPEETLAGVRSYREADPAAVTAVVAAVAGFFTHRALQPLEPGLPTLRAFQAAQGEVARRWLARRVGGSAAGGLQ